MSMAQGIQAVARRRCRGRALSAELMQASALLGIMLLMAFALKSFWFASGWKHTSSEGDRAGTFLRQSLVCEVTVASLLLPLAAALLGTAAQPSLAEEEEARQTLLAGLSPAALAGGRLLAALRLPLLAALLSLLCDGIVEFALHPLQEAGVQGVIETHLVLFCALVMAGCLAALGASGRRPGSGRVRGSLFAAITLLLMSSLILLLNPIMEKQNNPTKLIEVTLLINPAAAAAAPVKLDLLRTKWVYDHSIAPDFGFTYPPWWATTLLFLALGALAFLTAVFLMRRAYRED